MSHSTLRWRSWQPFENQGSPGAVVGGCGKLEASVDCGLPSRLVAPRCLSWLWSWLEGNVQRDDISEVPHQHHDAVDSVTLKWDYI